MGVAMLNAPGTAEATRVGAFARLVADACAASASDADWGVCLSRDDSQPWLWVSHAQARPPAQGWKLHVSATVASATDVLRAVLPILLTEDANFKLAVSLAALARLNEGNGGPTQAGKFITIYPNDDAQSVRLAVALDEATRGLAGPVVVTDRQLRPGSLVSYRYGSFEPLAVQTPVGEVLPALRAPDGALVPDRRMLYYNPPKWAVDPFLAAGAATRPRAPSVVVGGRYTLLSVLYRSPRGAVYLALDTEKARRCVLKRARRHSMAGPDGLDARDRLRAEARALTALSPDPRFPAVLDLFEHEGELYLVLEDVEGETLEQRVNELVTEGRHVAPGQVVAWGRELAAMLEAVHDRGFLYRDVKSTNVIVAPDGRLHLIDFDTAQCLAGPVSRSGRGTRGYSSLEQHAGWPPAITDDVYGLGALLYFLATSAEPSQAPNPFVLLDRPPALLNPAVGPALADVIARCLDPDPAKRYPSMNSVEAALAEAEAERPLPASPFGAAPAGESSEDARLRYHALARRLADTICGAAQPAPGGRGLAWSTRHPTSAGAIYSRDVNAGNAGTLLALAELVASFGDPARHAVLAGGARWLSVAPPFEGDRLPGLCVGEAGVGAALLRAGQVLGDGALIAAAAEKGRLVASLPFTSPDLFNGTAGRLRFHLLLWDETEAAEHLAAATQAGDSLLAAGEETRDGGLCWPIPPGYEGLSGAAYLGYAHGAAGIADALLDLFEATRERCFRDAAQRAARWLTQLAVPVLDESGLSWAAVEGHDLSTSWWCHGSTGIGRFFLHAARLGLADEGIAAAAARAAARAARWAGPTQCHGLAGNIEFLLDMFQATGDVAYLAEAQSLALLIEAFASERDGALVFPSESPDIFTPDYMVGYAGIALCLLRLSDPETQPHQLSRRGFRYRPAQAPSG